MLCLLSGCATNTAPSAEYAWQGLAFVDTLQTATIARSPACLYEADSIAAWVYGTPHPSESRVLLTNGALAALHYAVAGWLARHEWHITLRVFEAVSIAYSGQAVVHNIRMGITPAAGDLCTARHSFGR